MKLLSTLIIFASAVYILGGSSNAAESLPFHNGLSMQGFTGILNTPSAHVTREGDFYTLYTNQEENQWRSTVPSQDNYLFTVGLFNFVEFGGRFFEAPRKGRDLSANIKISSAPLTRNYPLLPVIAAGIQDIDGGARFLHTKYIVASEDIWRLRLSLGYGNGPDRMKGVFAGAELKAHDWIYLLGEYDTKETNLGIRAVVPPFWKIPLSFTATAKTSLDHNPGDLVFGVGFSLPLDFSMPATKPSPTDLKQMPEISPSAETVPATVAPKAPVNPTEATIPALPAPDFRIKTLEHVAAGKCMADIRDNLIRHGFLNVRVGQRESALFVEYENARYNHNELDALGIVAGMAAAASAGSDFQTLQIIIRKQDIAMLRLGTTLDILRSFLNGQSHVEGFRDALTISKNISIDDVVYIDGDKNSQVLKTSLMLYPGLSTWVGTEVGVFDYLLSLKPEIVLPVWKGATVNARWNIPLLWSENLEDGRTYRDSRRDSEMERLMLFQGIRLAPWVMANLGAGMIQHNSYGTLNELAWTPGDGVHQVRLMQAWSDDRQSHKQREVYLASYRYYFSPLDVSVEGTAGKFWAQDRGYLLELKRYFGDTAVSVYYKNSSAPDNRKWDSAGIQFSFPLTPRQDMKPGIVQIRGNQEWSYAQETTLKNNNYNNSRGSLNYFAPYPLNVIPLTTMNLSRSFFDRDRLNKAYIQQHIERIREAWTTYRFE